MKRANCLPAGMRRSMVGCGLIELMIALVLGLLVMGAAFAVFQSNQATYRANEGVNRIQESARVAFELMSRDLRSSGGGPCSNSSRVVTTDEHSLRFQNTPILTDSATEFTTISGDDASYRITGSTASSVTLDARDIPVARVPDVFEEDDWLLLCNASRTALVQITGVSGSVVSYTPSFNPLDEAHVSPTTASVARLRSVTWRTDDNDRGGRSLYVSRFNGDQEEVAEGVQSLALAYLVDGATSYTATPAAGAYITAVRINMVLSGQDVDGRPLTRTASNVVSLRSHTP